MQKLQKAESRDNCLWRFVKSHFQIFRMTSRRPILHLGDSHLPPTKIVPQLSKYFRTWKGSMNLYLPQFIQFKKINLFCLFKKKSQTCTSKLQKSGKISDYILNSHEISTSNYFTNLLKTTIRIFFLEWQCSLHTLISAPFSSRNSRISSCPQSAA